MISRKAATASTASDIMTYSARANGIFKDSMHRSFGFAVFRSPGPAVRTPVRAAVERQGKKITPQRRPPVM